jgi:serine/threonine protein kinase
MSIDEEKLWNIYEQCLRGLVYLHRMGLIHRDIKPANLLMNSKGEIKYTDFNVSAIINSDRAREFTKNKNEEEHLININ